MRVSTVETRNKRGDKRYNETMSMCKTMGCDNSLPFARPQAASEAHSDLRVSAGTTASQKSRAYGACLAARKPRCGAKISINSILLRRVLVQLQLYDSSQF
jgi:hypothetical protein